MIEKESNIFIDNTLKTWKEIEKLNCGRPDHSGVTLDWFITCLMTGNRRMVFDDDTKKSLRAEMWLESSGYYLCQQCYQSESPVRRYVARNVRIRPKR